MREIFTQFFLAANWGSEESLSGTGSTMAATEEIRRVIPLMLDHYDIQSIVDVPCGDMNWIANTDLRGARYLGGDVVPELVYRNKRKYGDLANVGFLTLDITRDPLPSADLLLVRDLLGHFSDADITKALANIMNSRSRYLLTTTFPAAKNDKDIETGKWRPINAEILLGAPPLEVIDEKVFDDNGKNVGKKLGLWDLEALRK